WLGCVADLTGSAARGPGNHLGRQRNRHPPRRVRRGAAAGRGDWCRGRLVAVAAGSRRRPGAPPRPGRRRGRRRFSPRPGTTGARGTAGPSPGRGGTPHRREHRRPCGGRHRPGHRRPRRAPSPRAPGRTAPRGRRGARRRCGARRRRRGPRRCPMTTGQLLLVAALALPALGAVAATGLPERGARVAGPVAATLTLLAVVGLSPWRSPVPVPGGHAVDPWHALDVAWVPGLDLRFHLGVDGISYPLLVLTALLTLLCCLHAR